METAKPERSPRRPPRSHPAAPPGAGRRQRAMRHVPDAGLPPEAAQPERIGHRRRGRGLHDRHRVAVPAPDDELLLQRAPPLRVGGALVHHVGERPDARARRGAGAPLGAGRPAVPARLAATGAGPLALGELLRAGAVARRRGTSCGAASDRPTLATRNSARRCDTSQPTAILRGASTDGGRAGYVPSMVESEMEHRFSGFWILRGRIPARRVGVLHAADFVRVTA